MELKKFFSNVIKELRLSLILIFLWASFAGFCVIFLEFMVRMIFRGYLTFVIKWVLALSLAVNFGLGVRYGLDMRIRKTDSKSVKSNWHSCVF